MTGCKLGFYGEHKHQIPLSVDQESYEMKFMEVQCKCGCGQKVQRGSNYFLQQSLGLKLGVEVIDLYEQKYLSHLATLTFGSGQKIGIDKLKNLRSRCHQMSNYMLTVAHEGPNRMAVSRSALQEMNLFVVQVICLIQKLDPSEIDRVGALTRMSRQQKMLYPSIQKMLNS